MTRPDTSVRRPRVRGSFARQRIMATMGAVVESVEAGRVALRLPFREDLTQQHGFLHAGVIAALADSACGYAALTLAPAGCEVLSVEFKVNLLRPAVGERFVAQGRVLKPGRTLSVARGDVLARTDGRSTLIATMLATLIVQPLARE